LCYDSGAVVLQIAELYLPVFPVFYRRFRVMSEFVPFRATLICSERPRKRFARAAVFNVRNL